MTIILFFSRAEVISAGKIGIGYVYPVKLYLDVVFAINLLCVMRSKRKIPKLQQLF